MIHVFTSIFICCYKTKRLLLFCTLPHAFQGDSVENKSAGQKKRGGAQVLPKSIYIRNNVKKLKGTVINLTFHSYKYVEDHQQIRHAEPLKNYFQKSPKVLQYTDRPLEVEYMAYTISKG